MKKDSYTKPNNTLLCDFYELTMMQGYFLNGFENKTAYFDIFFRKIPDHGSFAIFAGLEDILDFVSCLHFDEDDIAYLHSQGIFKEEFLRYLKNFKFKGEIYAMQEGEIIFPNEPLMIIKANAIEAQILESFLLLSINHQSLIATKANRIVRAAKNLSVLEFGTRRAHGSEAALKGARAAIIGGCKASSCTLAGKNYSIMTSGTMAHSWVQMFDDELSAFCHYLELYPQNPTLLIDTYNYKQGLENAVKAFKKFKIKQCGVRIDSGNLEILSKEIRTILDKNDLKECKIIVSNSLDEKSINKLLKNDAPIDAFGVGEKLITASSDPIFGCVYKLVAIEEDKLITPKIKISEDKQKITLPHFKKLFRIYDKNTQKMLFDELYIYNEKLPKLDENLERKELLKCVFKEGKILNKQKNVEEIALYAKSQISKLDEKFLNFNNKEKYKIKLSKDLTK
ncbi:nicotinate phosphoribosyltransferase, partial [Campylobacter coli]|nr:nicotinate phosphoribosyltransferase [Campylobacter coli]EKE4929366.1 nicotinate phosphoribosyltransferase [Campylobacter coli]